MTSDDLFSPENAELIEEATTYCDRGRTVLHRTRAFVLQATTLIDIFAVIPYWIETLFFAEGGGSQGFMGLMVLRMLRLTRLMRIFKLGKHGQVFQLFIRCMKR